MAQFKCTKECYTQKRLWKPGEIMTAEKSPGKYFQEIKTGIKKREIRPDVPEELSEAGASGAGKGE